MKEHVWIVYIISGGPLLVLPGRIVGDGRGTRWTGRKSGVVVLVSGVVVFWIVRVLKMVERHWRWRRGRRREYTPGIK